MMCEFLEFNDFDKINCNCLSFSFSFIVNKRNRTKNRKIKLTVTFNLQRKDTMKVTPLNYNCLFYFSILYKE
jgi:hypothetical protein